MFFFFFSFVLLFSSQNWVQPSKLIHSAVSLDARSVIWWCSCPSLSLEVTQLSLCLSSLRRHFRTPVSVSINRKAKTGPVCRRLADSWYWSPASWRIRCITFLWRCDCFGGGAAAVIWCRSLCEWEVWSVAYLCPVFSVKWKRQSTEH